MQQVGSTCPCRGQDIATIDREVRFREPDAVAALPAEERERRVNHDAGDFVRLAPDRCFVRGLLPVRLSDGHEFHFGVWIEVASATYETLAAVWNAPEYAVQRFEGRLANAVPPWGAVLLDKPCRVKVREVDAVPYISASTDRSLNAVLTEPWPRTECERLVAEVWER